MPSLHDEQASTVKTSELSLTASSSSSPSVKISSNTAIPRTPQHFLRAVWKNAGNKRTPSYGEGHRSSQLYELPTEIRNTIFNYAFGGDEEQHLHNFKIPSALNACHQMRTDALPVFFFSNHFIVTVECEFPMGATQSDLDHLLENREISLPRIRSRKGMKKFFDSLNNPAFGHFTVRLNDRIIGKWLQGVRVGVRSLELMASVDRPVIISPTVHSFLEEPHYKLTFENIFMNMSVIIDTLAQDEDGKPSHITFKLVEELLLTCGREHKPFDHRGRDKLTSGRMREASFDVECKPHDVHYFATTQAPFSLTSNYSWPACTVIMPTKKYHNPSQLNAPVSHI